MEKSVPVKFSTDIFSLVFLSHTLPSKFTAKLLIVLQTLCVANTMYCCYKYYFILPEIGIISRHKITFAPCNENKLFMSIFVSNQFPGNEMPVTSR